MDRKGSYHIPVMLKETLESIIVDKNGDYLDCTLGGGGHAKVILETISEKGTLLGIDRDKEAIDQTAYLSEAYNNFTAENISFANIMKLDSVVFGLKFDGILMDLGVSSHQIDDPKRGFSYMNSGKLDMRMNEEDELSAYFIVNNYTEDQLKGIFYKYGEENKAKYIARNICKAREENSIKTTKELSDIIERSVPYKNRIKTLSRIFQAIRIEVNNELGEIEEFLNISLKILKEHGRVAIMSYHSLEDRIVKRFINEMSTGCICPKDFPKCVCGKEPRVKKITKKPIVATEDEVKENSRARSAKLRVFELI
ncbi:MAG: 16S rRNA (cytosine(1402)-N(4))-methyltransferase RsmH [Candidatus Delongbacteria bacterium]|nr:16S rRNA (cytosine(1402)-N(4))-methyltransferase RsmH [Candidatus Delongbacteria bacterium]